jgi:3-polyprenyl-4-hydroxybenzoate decarboxylase
MVVIKLRPRFAGQARAALLAALSSPYLHPKIAVVVDEDIDISDLGQIYWAMANRVRETGDLQKIDRARVFALDNASPVEEGMSAMYRVGSKVMIDATKDFSLPRVQRRHRHELGQTPRADVIAALGVAADDPISDLARRLAATGLCAEAVGGDSGTAIKAIDLPFGASDGPWTGAILVVGQGDGVAPLIGIVDVRRDKRERLALGQLSWRLAEALRAAPTARRPAALLLGAPAACVLGAALDGWRGRCAWELAAAIAGETLSFETIAGGITVPGGTSLLVEGTLVESGRTEVIEWGFDVTAAASRQKKDSTTVTFETLRMDALAIEIAVAEHIRPIESGLDILDVCCFPETENRLVVVKLRPKVEGQSKTVCMGALSSPEIGPRLVITVDDDVDAGDLRDVSWSFASRLHAEYDVAGIDGLPATQDGVAEIGAVFKWFVDAAKPPLTQPENRAEFDRATPKNLSSTVLDDFLPD